MKKDIFSWLHVKKDKPALANSDNTAVTLPESQIEGLPANVQHIDPQQLIYGCGQSIGKQRDHNEDCVFALSIAIGGEKSSYPLGLYVVADRRFAAGRRVRDALWQSRVRSWQRLGPQ